MAAIHSKNTKPELLVRKYLFACGFRYRLNHPRLPGHPDIVLRKYRTVVFVNGCFWHGHEGCASFVLPKTNVDFWRTKIECNRCRDREEQQRLAAMGWHCVTVWECQLKPSVREQTLRSLAFTLNRIFISDHDTSAIRAAQGSNRACCVMNVDTLAHRYSMPPDETELAAEPAPGDDSQCPSADR